VIPATAQDGTINYEIELGVMLKRGGKHHHKVDWINDIGGYFLAIDYTDPNQLAKSTKAG